MQMFYNYISSVLLIFLIVINLSACGPLIIASAASGVAVLADRRTTGTYVEDKTIELKAFKNLNDDRLVADQSNVSLTSYNERVLITGQAINTTVKNKIENIVKNIPKVKTVYNEVKIAGKSSFTKSSYDRWITTKVKATLTADSRVNPLDIKVTTDNKTVYLMGLVDAKEAEIATDIARKVTGVERVVKLFEYLEKPLASEQQIEFAQSDQPDIKDQDQAQKTDSGLITYS